MGSGGKNTLHFDDSGNLVDSAKNMMFQAAQKAGYGVHRVNFHLVSESEAAAAYTLRANQPNDLNVGNTFVVCDAGGGTVDLVSYKIHRLNPLTLDEVVSGSGKIIIVIKPGVFLAPANAWVLQASFVGLSF
jgi:hypothetical protein